MAKKLDGTYRKVETEFYKQMPMIKIKINQHNHMLK